MNIERKIGVVTARLLLLGGSAEHQTGCTRTRGLFSRDRLASAPCEHSA
jgi:hypothetical protein